MKVPEVRCMLIKIIVMEIILKKRKYSEIQYNTENIQMLCITNVSYINLTQLKTYVRSNRSDRKIN